MRYICVTVLHQETAMTKIQLTPQLRPRNALHRTNISLAQTRWKASPESLVLLKELTAKYKLSIRLGELTLLNGNWYLTHAGLLRLAIRKRCKGIRVAPLAEFCSAESSRWVFEAVVYDRNGSGFYGVGDADPSNTSMLVRGAEMRIAETRAVNRALRKALGIGLCTVEELNGGPSGLDAKPVPDQFVEVEKNKLVSIPGHRVPLLRDRLNQLIQEYNLDAELVKRYAADFCGTGHLRDASRELVVDFIQTLAESAAVNRQTLIKKLESYSDTKEVSA